LIVDAFGLSGYVGECECTVRIVDWQHLILLQRRKGRLGFALRYHCFVLVGVCDLRHGKDGVKESSYKIEREMYDSVGVISKGRWSSSDEVARELLSTTRGTSVAFLR
jgi:hypothetical protein